MVVKCLFSCEALSLSYRGKSKGSHGNNRKGSRFFHSGKKQGLADHIANEKRKLETKIANGEVGDMSYVHGAIDAYTNVENMIPLDSETDECCTDVNAPLDARPLIFKTSIGHYGGMYVYMPEEKLDEFKAMFPKGLFPKNIEVKNVAESWTSYGVDAWHKRFPDSDRVAVVHFANASKGQKFLEDKITVPYAD
jgi:hypothetical protein